MKKNFLFIDDSGSKQWLTPYSRDFVNTPPSHSDQNKNFWRGNYFVLAGVFVSSDNIGELNTRIITAKKHYFGTKHVEIKSERLRNPEKRKKYYEDEYEISSENLTKFIEEEWYSLFNKENTLMIMSVVVDKRFFKDQRSKNTVLELATHMFLERIEKNINKDIPLEIVFDQMDSDIRSVKHEQGSVINVVSRRANIPSYYDNFTHNTIRFEESKDSNFLQLADTVAYNVFRQFVDYGDCWNPWKSFETCYPFFEKLIPLFHQTKGQIHGVGLIKHPRVPDKIIKKDL